MIPILENNERAQRTILFFYLLLATIVIETIFIFLQQKTGFMSESIPIGNYQLSYISVIVTMLSYVSFATQIAVIVTFLQWFRRAYHNLEKAGYPNEYSNGWAVGFWFIPIANFFIPYQITKEIWYKTQKEYTTNIQEHGLLRIWWLLYIPGQFIMIIIVTLVRKGELLVFFNPMMRVASTIAVIQVIKRIAFFEELFRVHVTAETVGQVVHATEDDTQEEAY